MLLRLAEFSAIIIVITVFILWVVRPAIKEYKRYAVRRSKNDRYSIILNRLEEEENNKEDSIKK